MSEETNASGNGGPTLDPNEQPVGVEDAIKSGYPPAVDPEARQSANPAPPIDAKFPTHDLSGNPVPGMVDPAAAAELDLPPQFENVIPPERRITAHEVEPNCGNVPLYPFGMREGIPHKYAVGYGHNPWVVLQFQTGPIKEHGVNGITEACLLAIVQDRLECFQKGEFQCPENQQALVHVEQALYFLHRRTTERAARGVEGTSEV